MPYTVAIADLESIQLTVWNPSNEGLLSRAIVAFIIMEM
jgi:hypothetical protein